MNSCVKTRAASELVGRLVAVVLRFFSFQLSPKTIVFLYVHHKIKYNCCQASFSVFFFFNLIVYLVFLQGKCRKGSFFDGAFVIVKLSGGLWEKSFNISNL